MILSENGGHTPMCDYCGDELSTEFDFYDAVAAMKSEGWHSVNENGEWSNYCLKCYAERLWDECDDDTK